MLDKHFLKYYNLYFEKNYLPKSEGGAGWKVDKRAHFIEYDKLGNTYMDNVDYLRKWLENKNDFNDVTIEIYNKNTLIAALNVNDLDFKAVKDLVKKIEK